MATTPQWNKTADTPPPATDGAQIWGYLFDSGIKLLAYWSAEQIADEEGGSPDEYQAGWYEDADTQFEWTPRYWLPVEAIPQPPRS